MKLFEYLNTLYVVFCRTSDTSKWGSKISTLPFLPDSPSLRTGSSILFVSISPPVSVPRTESHDLGSLKPVKSSTFRSRSYRVVIRVVISVVKEQLTSDLVRFLSLPTIRVNLC